MGNGSGEGITICQQFHFPLGGKLYEALDTRPKTADMDGSGPSVYTQLTST